MFVSSNSFAYCFSLFLQDFKDQEHIEFSGPMLSQPQRMDDVLLRNESYIRRKSRFERGMATFHFQG